MKMKKLLCIVLTVVMALTMLVGCNSGGDSKDNEDGTKTLKVALWDQTTNPSFSVVIDAFKAAHEDVTVEVIDIPSADYGTKLPVMLNGNAEVDVFWIKDADTLYPIAQRGQLADLSTYISDDQVDLTDYNGLDEYFNIDGKQVALPYRSDYYVLYYNKDIFDAAGEAYPSNDMTWTEFEALAKKLTKGEGAEKVYGAHFHTWQALVQNWAVQDGKNTIMATDYGFMQPYYEMILRMQNTDKSVMDYGTLKSGNISYNSVFPEGTVAMMPMGTWFTATMIDKVNKGESDVNWGIAACPHPEGTDSGYVVGSTTPIAMNEKASDKDLAWEFIKFASSEEAAKLVAESGAIPGLVNDDILGILAGVEGMPEGVLEAMNVENFSLDRPIADNVSEVNQMLGEEHALIMLGESSVEDALKEMAEQSATIQGK